MKLIKNILFICSLFALNAINALSVQDLIDNGQCPEVEINYDGLKKLNLSYKNLTSLDGLQNIPSIQQVQILNSTNNKLTQLPTTIGSLTNLKKLYLHTNKLTQLPSTIGSLTNLQSLNLDNNQLTQLPSTIGSLINLECLYLDNNYLNIQDIEKIINDIELVICKYKKQYNPLELAREKICTKEMYKLRQGTQNIIHMLHAHEAGGFSTHVLSHDHESKSKKRKRDSFLSNKFSAKRIKR
jgi:Leucine rich repeat